MRKVKKKSRMLKGEELQEMAICDKITTGGMTMKLEIEYLKVKDLTPYENNARKHEEDDVEYIKNSIQEFGMNDPIGIWSDKNIIVEGHGRLLACKELGMQEVPCIRLDNLTDEQRKAYALAHNKTAEMSAWDFNLLDEELAGLENFNMEDFGFENTEIDWDNVDGLENYEEPKEKEYICPCCGNTFLKKDLKEAK